MNDNNTTVVIGAGPYGLSIAAHLREKNIPVRIFGKTMEFWQKMPTNMYLKSSWSGLSLSDPKRAYTLNRYSKLFGIPWQEPVPLQLFLKYCRWFQEQAVPDVDETYVQMLRKDGDIFQLELADGRQMTARHVVIASGVAPLAHIPEFARDLPSFLASHSQEHSDFSRFAGQKVVVVGSGQSAFESAALLHEAGAEVEVIARGPVIWINRRLYHNTGPARRIFYPPSDVGPAGVSWLVAYPLLFSHLPDSMRVSIDRRSVRPSVAPWLRPRVDGRFTITPNMSIEKAMAQEGSVHLKLSDGSIRTVDHILLGTGYKANLDALTYIDEPLRRLVKIHNGYPLLNERFESSATHLYFAGALAGFNFGPICRFVAGVRVPAQQITRHVMQTGDVKVSA